MSSTFDEAIELGMKAARDKVWDVAIDHFKDALGIDPTSVHALRLLAFASHEAGRFAEAEVLLRDVLRRDPNDAQARSYTAKNQQALESMLTQQPVFIEENDDQEQRPKRWDPVGIVLLLIPIATIPLAWFWILPMPFTKDQELHLNIVRIAAMVCTGMIAAYESSKGDLRKKVMEAKGWSKPRPAMWFVWFIPRPAQWFVWFVFSWAIAFPLYMTQRKHLGFKGKGLLGLGVVIAVIISALFVSKVIEVTIHQVPQSLSSTS